MLSTEASGKAPEPPHSELFGGFRATPPGLRGAALLDADFVNGLLEASGSADVAANQLRLRARNLPANVTILPLASRQAGFVPNLGGSPGTLCLGGLVGRDLVHVGTSTAWGEAAYAPDVANLPTPNTYVAALLGETWHFQLWYRDLATIGGSNLTDAVAVTLQ